jgi:hypothetical protein
MADFEVRVVVSADSAQDAVGKVIRTDGSAGRVFVTDVSDPALAEVATDVPGYRCLGFDSRD